MAFRSNPLSACPSLSLPRGRGKPGKSVQIPSRRRLFAAPAARSTKWQASHILRSHGGSDYFRFSLWDGEGVDHDPPFSRGYDFDLLVFLHSEPCDCTIGP